MGALACIFGILGGLCAVMGIITAVEVVPEAAMVPEVAGLTWLFWFVLSAILLLICIAFASGRGGGYK